MERDETFIRRVALLITPRLVDAEVDTFIVDFCKQNPVVKSQVPGLRTLFETEMRASFPIRLAVEDDEDVDDAEEYDIEFAYDDDDVTDNNELLQCQAMHVFQLLLVIMNILPRVTVYAWELDGVQQFEQTGGFISRHSDTTTGQEISLKKPIDKTLADAYAYYKAMQLEINKEIVDNKNVFTYSDYEPEVDFATRVAIHMRYNDNGLQPNTKGGGTALQTVQLFVKKVKAFWGKMTGNNTSFVQFTNIGNRTTTTIITPICAQMGTLLGEGTLGSVYSGGLHEINGVEECIAIKMLLTSDSRDSEISENNVVRSVCDPVIVRSSTLLLTADKEIEDLNSLKLPSMINYRTKPGIVDLKTAIHREDMSMHVDHLMLMMHPFLQIYCHTDIKPHNIMVDTDYNLYIIDFERGYWTTGFGSWDSSVYKKYGIKIPSSVRDRLLRYPTEENFAAFSVLLTACLMSLHGTKPEEKEGRHVLYWKTYCRLTKTTIRLKYPSRVAGAGQPTGRHVALLGATGALLLTTLVASLVRR